ncbi:uncharacterized protein LOC114472631 [Gouania willdenowi]|uniref:uncharacterized protein LOC114472631 n=1 Tax=Gouania willdenowi TaxID=441366 RepID=UPI001055F433|nr:uncharacterized protein LOC114472631 [Gouania willdenowi]
MLPCFSGGMTYALNGVQIGPGNRTMTRTRQGRQDCYFYQINPILRADKTVESERQLLVEEQKECKDKNRKFCQETNSHRRKLDDRRRQWNMQERRREEKILQQRREQIQDATERCRRANQPPAQKRRPTIPAFSGKVINLDDAMKQIGGSFNMPHSQSSCLSMETIRASSLIPIEPATVSTSHHHPLPSAVESNTDVVQEQNKTEPEQDPSPQDIHQSDCLLFKDSLECEDDVCDTNKDQQVFSSFLMNAEKASSNLHSQYNPTLDLAPYAGLTLVGVEASKKPTKRNHNNRDKTEWRHVSKPSWEFTPFETLSHEEFQKAPHNYNFCGGIGEPFVMHARSSEVLSPKLEALLDLKQKVILESLQSASTLKSHSDAAAGPEEESHVTQISGGRSDISDEVGCTKGILKINQYEKKSGHLGFKKQETIRDSIELTEAKFKKTEGSNAVRKKVRWLHLEEEAQKQNSNKSAEFIQLRNDYEDHQPLATTPPGAPRLADSTASRRTKKTWTEVGVQVSLVVDETNEVTVPQDCNRRAGLEVPRREHATAARAFPVSSTTPKRILVRTQSAAELSRIAKSKGKSMIPRLPPRTRAVKGRTACDQKAPYGAAQASHVTPADRSHAAYAPLPSAFTPTFSENNSKTPHTSLHQDAHSRARETSSKKLQLTRTDEEVTQLWQGLRRGLTPKEGKTSTKGYKPPGSGFRNPCTQPWPPGNRHLTPQPINLNAQQLKSSNIDGWDFRNEGSDLESVQTQRQPVIDISFEEQEILISLERLNRELQWSDLESVETQRQPVIDISFEEQEILLSLERLNRELQCK